MAHYMVGLTREDHSALGETDEILMFVYYGVYMWDRTEEKAVECKVRIAPRKFESIYLVKPEKARLVYWSSKIGLRISKVDMKEKSGVLRFDRDELISTALDKFRYKTEKATRLTKADLEMLDDIRAHIKINNNAFHRDYSSYEYDWHTHVNRIYYRKGIMKIENYDVKSIEMDTHTPNTEYSWYETNVTIDGGRISLGELKGWSDRFKDYSAELIVEYYDGDELKQSSIEWKGAFDDKSAQIICEGELFE